MQTNDSTKPISRTTEYYAWWNMLERCNRETNPVYHLYGGRGISVDPRWTKFKNFLDDMGHKPTPRHTLDRTNNDGNYCKENCRWTTMKIQSANRRTNKTVTIDGVTRCFSEWCEIHGVDRSLANKRMKRLGWSPERAVTAPPDAKASAARSTENVALYAQLREGTGHRVNSSTVSLRVSAGWTLEDAIKTPARKLTRRAKPTS